MSKKTNKNYLDYPVKDPLCLSLYKQFLATSGIKEKRILEHFKIGRSSLYLKLTTKTKKENYPFLKSLLLLAEENLKEIKLLFKGKAK